ncbi:uncharacterized protein G2W53_013672 [Senna tora]|uniref:Uncharacterized protein n=1 Tax=Senna tora TaxID=362788 RepID=A0A834U044_9FABA|nr:uncharacterized protein G2W53_013672 [Senna tora]
MARCTGHDDANMKSHMRRDVYSTGHDGANIMILVGTKGCIKVKWLNFCFIAILS